MKSPPRCRPGGRSGPTSAGLALLVAAALLVAPHDVRGQARIPSWLSVDSSASIDRSLTEAAGTTGVILDTFVSAQIRPGVEIYARPFVQRLQSREWNRQLWLAAARYERKGRLSLRVDGGIIPPPIGLANLTLRPHLNPTIAQPASLFQRLPDPEPLGPRVTLLGAVYPYGVSATVSGTRWDARGAVIDASPLRARRVFSPVNPPQFANVVVGGGVTPLTGLRIGASVTRGGWKRASEQPVSSATLKATVISVETELAIRYTKLAGEWTRDVIGTTTGRAVAHGWYVQGLHTLTPRFFAGARVEHIGAPRAQLSPLEPPSAFSGTEETVGFRLTPDVTFRVSHRARRQFAQGQYLNQLSGSIVWARRWF